MKIRLPGSAFDRSIESKGYMRPYEGKHKRITKEGINFSMDERTIAEWKTE